MFFVSYISDINAFSLSTEPKAVYLKTSVYEKYISNRKPWQRMREYILCSITHDARLVGQPKQIKEQTYIERPLHYQAKGFQNTPDSCTYSPSSSSVINITAVATSLQKINNFQSSVRERERFDLEKNSFLMFHIHVSVLVCVYREKFIIPQNKSFFMIQYMRKEQESQFLQVIWLQILS